MSVVEAFKACGDALVDLTEVERSRVIEALRIVFAVPHAPRVSSAPNQKGQQIGPHTGATAFIRGMDGDITAERVATEIGDIGPNAQRRMGTLLHIICRSGELVKVRRGVYRRAA